MMLNASHIKCDACLVKFEARKYFTGVGAYFTVVKCEDEKRKLLLRQPADRKDTSYFFNPRLFTLQNSIAATKLSKPLTFNV
ncbi:hypothetical protein ES708_25989 [subsurface metagenome]